MALARLPNEMMEQIITCVIPEGFESAALTCRKLYTLCISFIKRYNTLRLRFQHFTYYERRSDPSISFRSSFDLIARIAVEPVIARYIVDANFRCDSFFKSGQPREFKPKIPNDCGDAVRNLLADSTYLEASDLDAREFYNAIEEDFEAKRYSQHAAAFLLTLLPNVKMLRLPKYWKPLEATDKLIDTLVRRAKQSTQHLLADRPSLAQVSRFGPSVSLGPQERCDLAWASPFLALPHVRSFRGPSCVATSSDFGHDRTSSSKAPHHAGLGPSTLGAVHLVSCCISPAGIAGFLAHTPCLRTLRYSHCTKEGVDADWDICNFITAIERATGAHLEELSVSICELRGEILPGKPSMHGFRRLRKLELPIEVAGCNSTAAAVSRIATPIISRMVGGGSIDHNNELDDAEAFSIADLVPSSVAQLSLISAGTAQDAMTLEVMFRDFSTRKDEMVPKLDEIHLSCSADSDDKYKEQCARIFMECERGGTVCHLELWPSSIRLTWDEGE